MFERLTRFSLDRTIVVSALLTALFASPFPRIHIDTDPENMLEADQPDRVYYDRIKDELGVRDMLVVGIVDKRGVFTEDALRRVSYSSANFG